MDFVLGKGDDKHASQKQLIFSSALFFKKETEEDNTTASTDLDTSYQGRGGDWSSNCSCSYSPPTIRRISSSNSNSQNNRTRSIYSPLSPLLCHDDNISPSSLSKKSFMPNKKCDERNENEEEIDSSLWRDNADREDRNHVISSPPPKTTSPNEQLQRKDMSPYYQPTKSPQRQRQSGDSFCSCRRFSSASPTSSTVVAALQRELNEAKRQIEVFQFAWNEEQYMSAHRHMDVDILCDRFWQLQEQLDWYQRENALLRQQQHQQHQPLQVYYQPHPPLAERVKTKSSFLLRSPTTKEQSPISTNDAALADGEKDESILSKLKLKNATLRCRLEEKISKVTGSFFSSAAAAASTYGKEEMMASGTGPVHHVDNLEQHLATRTNPQDELGSRLGSIHLSQETHQEEIKLLLQEYDIRLESELCHDETADTTYGKVQAQLESLLVENKALVAMARRENLAARGYETGSEAEAFGYEILETKHAKVKTELEKSLLVENKALVEREKAREESIAKDRATMAILRLENSQLAQKLQEQTQLVVMTKEEMLVATNASERLQEEANRLREELAQQRGMFLHASSQQTDRESHLTSDLEQHRMLNVQLESQLEKLQDSKKKEMDDMRNAWVGRCTSAGMRYSTLKNHHDMVQTERNFLQSRNEELLVDYQNLQASLRDYQERQSVLDLASQQAKDEAKSEIERLSAELLECRNRLDEIETLHSDCIREVHSTFAFGLF